MAGYGQDAYYDQEAYDDYDDAYAADEAAFAQHAAVGYPEASGAYGFHEDAQRYGDPYGDPTPMQPAQQQQSFAEAMFGGSRRDAPTAGDEGAMSRADALLARYKSGGGGGGGSSSRRRPQSAKSRAAGGGKARRGKASSSERPRSTRGRVEARRETTPSPEVSPRVFERAESPFSVASSAPTSDLAPSPSPPPEPRLSLSERQAAARTAAAQEAEDARRATEALYASLGQAQAAGGEADEADEAARATEALHAMLAGGGGSGSRGTGEAETGASATTTATTAAAAAEAEAELDALHAMLSGRTPADAVRKQSPRAAAAPPPPEVEVSVASSDDSDRAYAEAVQKAAAAEAEAELEALHAMLSGRTSASDALVGSPSPPRRAGTPEELKAERATAALHAMFEDVGGARSPEPAPIEEEIPDEAGPSPSRGASADAEDAAAATAALHAMLGVNASVEAAVGTLMERSAGSQGRGGGRIGAASPASSAKSPSLGDHVSEIADDSIMEESFGAVQDKEDESADMGISADVGEDDAAAMAAFGSMLAMPDEARAGGTPPPPPAALSAERSMASVRSARSSGGGSTFLEESLDGGSTPARSPREDLRAAPPWGAPSSPAPSARASLDVPLSPEVEAAFAFPASAAATSPPPRAASPAEARRRSTPPISPAKADVPGVDRSVQVGSLPVGASVEEWYRLLFDGSVVGSPASLHIPTFVESGKAAFAAAAGAGAKGISAAALRGAGAGVQGSDKAERARRRLAALVAAERDIVAQVSTDLFAMQLRGLRTRWQRSVARMSQARAMTAAI